MTDLGIIAVFFAGLPGGVHCVGMCGSITDILTAQTPTGCGGRVRRI